jgi:hypothetical protein
MSSLFNNFPLKNSCRNQLSQYCGENNFDNLLERFFAINSTTKCGNMLRCENVTDSSPESERLFCGDIFSSTFLQESYRPSFSGLTYPCRSINETEQKFRYTSFIEKNFLKERQGNSQNSSSIYIDTSVLSTSQKEELRLLKRAVEYQMKFPVSVDLNSDFMMNPNVESDLRKINKNVLVYDYFANSLIMNLSYILIFLSVIILF